MRRLLAVLLALVAASVAAQSTYHPAKPPVRPNTSTYPGAYSYPGGPPAPTPVDPNCPCTLKAGVSTYPVTEAGLNAWMATCSGVLTKTCPNPSKTLQAFCDLTNMGTIESLDAAAVCTGYYNDFISGDPVVDPHSVTTTQKANCQAAIVAVCP